MEIIVNNVDLTSVIRTDRDYDDEGDCTERRGVTLGEAVAEQIADDLKKHDEYPGLRSRVLTIREELIREHVTPTIEQLAAAPIRKTNGYGEHKGEELTLRELILDLAVEELTKDSGGYHAKRGMSVIALLVQQEVDKVVTARLAAMHPEIKAQVVARVDAHFTELTQKALAAK